MLNPRPSLTNADDLRALIRALGADWADPAAVTAAVLVDLSDAECRVVAATTLHDYVRRQLVKPTAATFEPVAEIPAPAPVGRSYETQAGQRTPSAKVAALRDWVAGELRRSICVDAVAGTWKFLADCTAEDCASAASIRHEKATQNQAEAERFEKIAAALDEAGAATISDLPRATLEAVLR